MSERTDLHLQPMHNSVFVQEAWTTSRGGAPGSAGKGIEDLEDRVLLAETSSGSVEERHVSASQSTDVCCCKSSLYKGLGALSRACPPCAKAQFDDELLNSSIEDP